LQQASRNDDERSYSNSATGARPNNLQATCPNVSSLYNGNNESSIKIRGVTCHIPSKSRKERKKQLISVLEEALSLFENEDRER
jgi:hypothetical protein